MTTQITTTRPSLFIDTEDASIAYSEATLALNQEKIQRSQVPFSDMKSGKFRKLFDRHVLTYKH